MSIIQRVVRIALIVEAILFLGFLPTLFNPNAHIYGGPGGGWDWSPWGFVGPMAALLFLDGLAIDYVARKIQHPMYRALAILCLIFLVIGIWGWIVRSE